MVAENIRYTLGYALSGAKNLSIERGCRKVAPIPMEVSMLISHIRKNFSSSFFPRLSGWGAAGVTVFIGWRLMQDPTFMQNAARGYGIMLEVAPQGVWAFWFIVLGGVRLMILLVNGAIKRSPWWRAFSAGFSCFLWTCVWLSMKEVQGLTFCMVSGYLWMDFMNILRTMQDARTVDDALKDQRSGK